jgi:hypothetical protein
MTEADDRDAARDRLPVVIVSDTSNALVAAATTAEVAGLRTSRGWSLAMPPWDLSNEGVVVVGSLDGHSIEGELVDAVVRGAGAVVGIDRRRRGVARLVEALRRTAPLLDWYECPTMHLDPEQIRLLHRLAIGASAREAARSVHLSERTAHRRMADARDLLEATTTNAAAAKVNAAVRAWSTSRARSELQ